MVSSISITLSAKASTPYHYPYHILVISLSLSKKQYLIKGNNGIIKVKRTKGEIDV